jgi:hypothetical protein|tara:strand:+ start:253 stop:1131 length:879 start_codon:yes stop_codon:yes gene_type:complete
MLDINKYYDPNNPYSSFWAKTKNELLPERMNNLIEIEFDDFKDKFFNSSKDNAKNLYESLLSGNIYILKNTFSKNFCSELKKYVIENKFSNEKSEFHKIYDGVPNFCRFINEDLSKNYAFKQVKMTSYFFPFNEHNETFKLYDQIYPKWRVLKFISGYQENVWENTIPSDGIVDRIQVVRYPPKSGFLELHQDPFVYQKFFISSYLTKKGVDYLNGGMYAIDNKNKEIDLEKYIDIGDLCFGIATIYHGVNQCEENNETKTNNLNSGRWFLGLYTTESNYQVNRHTGKPAKI